MLTKGIIVDSEEIDSKDSKFHTYTIRIPILHGYSSDSGGCPDNQLPNACVYAGLPGEQTVFQKGDVVLVDLSDYNPEWPVILGMLPHASKSTVGISGKGADKTTSGLSIKNVQNITFDKDDGKAKLPKNTIVYTEDTFRDKDHIDGKEISQLKFVRQPIQVQLDDLSNSISSIISNLTDANIWVDGWPLVGTVSDTTTVDSTTYSKKLNKTRSSSWLNNSHKNMLNFNYVFRYIGDNKWVYPSDNPLQTITRSELSTYGVQYLSEPPEDTILSVAITIGVIPIEMGGTGADSAEGARENLEVFKDVLISETEFNNLRESDYKLNTIYYIYEEA